MCGGCWPDAVLLPACALPSKALSSKTLSPMQETVKKWLDHSLASLRSEGKLSASVEPRVTAPKQREHGDYTSNVALVLAEQSSMDARALARLIVERLPASSELEAADVAGPGFINFHLKQEAEKRVFSVMLKEIANLGERYGSGWIKGSPRALVEFVSANPTGPLHVGHGRGAAYGEAVSALLEAAGYEVEREYYVNDAGRQMDILTTSAWLRYLELGGERFDFPEVGYQGDYVWDIAAEIRRTRGDRLHRPAADIQARPEGVSDGEKLVDGVIENCKRLIGGENYAALARVCVEMMMQSISGDLKKIGIHTRWFSEKALSDSGEIARTIGILQDKGHLYEREGALWFRSSAFGDEKDRVVVRANGNPTYFASDVAYHRNKFQRGYDLIVNVWGADHHGYIPRVRAALEALGLEVDKIRFLLVQFVNLYRNGSKVAMSTRGGEFVTLRELHEEVGRDAERFFYVMRKPGQHMDFDITLAKEKSNENPVYYIQYAHARVCNVFRELKKRKLDFSDDVDAMKYLTQDLEMCLVRRLYQYKEVLKSAATEMAPHVLLGFLRELAGEFHAYYNHSQFLVDDGEMRSARLVLIGAVRQILSNGLGLLGVSAPQRM